MEIVKSQLSRKFTVKKGTKKLGGLKLRSKGRKILKEHI